MVLHDQSTKSLIQQQHAWKLKDKKGISVILILIMIEIVI